MLWYQYIANEVKHFPKKPQSNTGKGSKVHTVPSRDFDDLNSKHYFGTKLSNLYTKCRKKASYTRLSELFSSIR